MSDVVRAPFTPEQVRNLNACQESGLTHPFTCGKGGHDHGILVARKDGWYCPKCDYTQDWAHTSMADEGFLKRLAAVRELTIKGGRLVYGGTLGVMAVTDEPPDFCVVLTYRKPRGRKLTHIILKPSEARAFGCWLLEKADQALTAAARYKTAEREAGIGEKTE